MKKIISVFMAILMVFCSCAVAVSAADVQDVETSETTTVESDEVTTRSIKADNGMVVPINFDQLKSAFVFKLFEKIIIFILSIFDGGESIDESAATAIDEIGSVLDERLSQLSSDLNNQ